MTSVEAAVPEVSVIMSVFNSARRLRATVDSILAQEGVSFEFIVINDGSSDDTATILDEYAARDRRMRVVHQENTGLTRALIRGCAMARGRFIARQDSDDQSLPGRLSKLAELIRNDPAIAIATSGIRSVGPNGETLLERRVPGDWYGATRRVLGGIEGPPCHGSVMFPIALYKKVGGYRSAFYYAQDSDLWMRLCEHGQLAFVSEVLYEFRIDPSSISSVWRPIQMDFGRLAFQTRLARLNGEGEAIHLESAEQLSAKAIKSRRSRDPALRRAAEAAGNYFIACALIRRGDWKSFRYLCRAFEGGRKNAKVLLRMALLPIEILLWRSVSSVRALRTLGGG